MNKILNILIGASLLVIGWAEGSSGVVSDFYSKYKIVEANGGRYYSNGYDLTKLFEGEYGWGKVRPDYFEKQEAKRREAAEKQAAKRFAEKMARDVGGSEADWEKSFYKAHNHIMSRYRNGN